MILLLAHSTFWPIAWAVIYGFNLAIAIYASVTMILRKQDPVKTLAWTVVLLLIPYIGVLFYLYFGQNIRKRKIFSRKGLADLNYRRQLAQIEKEGLEQYPELFDQELEPFKKLITQNLANSYSLVDYNNNIEFWFNGRDALDAMYSHIEQAQSHIHIQTYIIEDDRIGRKFIDLFKQKALNGVEVRLMYDGVGSIHFKKRVVKEMRECGVEVLEFSPVKFYIPGRTVNYRNHRKILVVDGKVGFIGGVNIADRYYFGNQSGLWYDTQIKIEGESVSSLQASFLLDRYFVLNHKLRYSKKYYPRLDFAKVQEVHNQSFYRAQIISSGPDSDWAGIMQCYFTAINTARDHIYIVTPYFTPNETILDALKVAALGGVKVKIMIPKTSDSRAAYYSTRSYFTELLEAGVEFYLFTKGFNHSKVISVDGKMAIIGSANMDVRSFEHNFEIMGAMYSKYCSQTIETQFIADLKESVQIKLRSWKQRSAEDKIFESIYRLLSPLL